MRLYKYIQQHQSFIIRECVGRILFWRNWQVGDECENNTLSRVHQRTKPGNISWENDGESSQDAISFSSTLLTVPWMHLSIPFRNWVTATLSQPGSPPQHYNCHTPMEACPPNIPLLRCKWNETNDPPQVEIMIVIVTNNLSLAIVVVGPSIWIWVLVLWATLQRMAGISIYRDIAALSFVFIKRTCSTFPSRWMIDGLLQPRGCHMRCACAIAERAPSHAHESVRVRAGRFSPSGKCNVR